MIIKKKIKKSEVIEETPITSDSSEQKFDIEEENIDLFNLDNIDFKQRQERRRGDRRRGFRRIDDRNLISRAREEAQTIKEAAFKEGYQQGLSQAGNDIEEVKLSLAQFLNAKQEVFDYVVPQIMDISLEIAKKIIKKEIEQDSNIIINNIKEILKGLSKEERKITLRVNSNQVDLLKSEIPNVLVELGLDAKIMVVPDESVYEGGCMIATTNGIIDATIETQLSIISEALKEI